MKQRPWKNNAIIVWFEITLVFSFPIIIWFLTELMQKEVDWRMGLSSISFLLLIFNWIKMVKAFRNAEI